MARAAREALRCLVPVGRVVLEGAQERLAAIPVKVSPRQQ
jgi:hypothetical protein